MVAGAAEPLAGASERLTAAAVRLADQQSSRLIGLTPLRVGDTTGPASAAEREAVRRLVEHAGRRFDGLTRTLRAGRSWRPCEGSLFDALQAEAWAGDLIMLGAHDLQAELPPFLLRRLLLRTACPVLVWPERPRPAAIAHAAVLCDDSPAAARALRAAAPLLVRCTRISLVGACRLSADARRGFEARGVPEVRVTPLGGTLSAGVARRLAETPADLIVLGAWSEVLGGWPKRSVTDLLLGAPPAPLLLAA